MLGAGNCIYPIATSGDGRRLSSSDNSHVSYPVGDVEHGECPSTHPKRFITLFFEAVFDVQDFPYRTNAWTFSYGDQTGLGFHGDFISQWDTGVLQAAINQASLVGRYLTSFHADTGL